MKTIIGACALALLLNAAATAQTALDGNSLTWLIGNRVAMTAAGAKTYEAFTGPQNGVVTGTALAVNGTYTEYHKIGPQMGGPANAPYGLSVANPRSNMAWGFTVTTQPSENFTWAVPSRATRRSPALSVVVLLALEKAPFLLARTEPLTLLT